jgi:hypothetical protein
VAPVVDLVGKAAAHGELEGERRSSEEAAARVV